MASRSVVGIFIVIALLGMATARSAPNKPARYVRTPVGLVWSDCLHQMESGSHIIEDVENNITRIISPSGDIQIHDTPCPMPIRRTVKAKIGSSGPMDGWQVWTTFQHPSNDTFTSFLGNFSVPASPTTFGESGILYMFTGLQSDNWVPISHEPPAPPSFDIIQPVLQYGGGSESGGGKYWAMASWYVTLNGGTVFSPLMKLKPGDVIFGNMTQVSKDTWFIASVADGYNTNVTVTHPRLASQPWAYNTLELYNIDSCTWMPPSGSACKFTNLLLTDASGTITPVWNQNNNGAGNHCTSSLSITNPNNLAINF